jgi:hypothetical protein
MSLTASPLADAPYAATIHAVELDDFGHSFRPVAPGLFTCPIEVAPLERREQSIVSSPLAMRRQPDPVADSVH